MIKHSYFLRYLFLKMLLVSISQVNAAQEQKFPVAIGAHSFYAPIGKFFVAANQAVAGNNYSIAVATRSNTRFMPLSPEKVILNNKWDQDNPLFGKAIKLLAPMIHKALVVSQDDPTRIYVVDDAFSTHNVAVFASDTIADPNGNPITDIKAITGHPAQLLEEPENLFVQTSAFVAASNKEGSYDIAVLLLTPKEIEENKTIQKQFHWTIFNAQTGDLNGNRAVCLGKDNDAVKINNKITQMYETIDMHFDADLKRLYIALSVQAGCEDNDGARAIVCGAVVNGKLEFIPIAPNSAFNFNNKIVGGLGANAKISINKVRTMQTRSHLRYLVVVGGNVTSSDDTKQQVYALPLVDNENSTSHGTLAKISSKPIDVFLDSVPSAFESRNFLESAQVPEDLYTYNNLAACVGNDSKLPGSITDIQVSGDSIFVSVDQKGNGQQPGIFYSQALFDSSGRICQWTKWQRASGLVQGISGFALDAAVASFWVLPSSGESVMTTMWSSGKSQLEKYIEAEFDKKLGGVHSLQDFPFFNQGLSANLGSRISLIVFAGTNKLILMQSGSDNGGFFGPNELPEDLSKVTFSSSDGTLTGLNNADVSIISISGGDLKQIGTIESVEIVTDGKFAWLLVGGTGGLAVLANADGSGWDAKEGLGSNFSGLYESMAFKKIGSYRNIRKLISHGEALYILTPFRLYKAKLSESSIRFNKIQSVTLAKSEMNELRKVGFFSDMLISGPLALLATSNGLFRSGNGIDISKISKTNPRSKINWTPVPLPESAGSFKNMGPVSRLFAISTTGLAKDVIFNGNIYVLNAYTGYHQAQLYRLTLSPGTEIDPQVNNETVKLIPDMFINGKLSFFVNFGEYRNYIATDGAIISSSRSAYIDQSPFLEFAPIELKSGKRFGTRNSLQFAQKDFHSIGQLIRNSASGAWMLPGDFGLRANE